MSLRSSKIETIALLHLALLGVFSTWALGGGAPWSSRTICVFGSIAPLIMLAKFREQPVDRKLLLLLLPLLGFNVFVLLGLLQPGLHVTSIEGQPIFIIRNDLSFWPVSSRPELTRRALWLFDAIFLSSFNLLVAIQRRKALRTLLFIICANALTLAVFGSIQKFTQDPGIFFGQVPSPNAKFFSSFIYHNHWGAFAVLMLAVCLGLLFHQRKQSSHRDIFHSPAPIAVVVIFILAVTIPLSGSRSCTIIAVLLIAGAFVHGLRRFGHYYRAEGKSIAMPAAVLVLTAAAALIVLFILARPSIETRIADTRAQFAQMQIQGNVGTRAQLYHDTLRMASDRPWFGWGLGSFGTVFTFYNTQHAVDNLPQYYEDAHSDWLQLFAETGIVGVLCFLALLAAPLVALPYRLRVSSLPRYLFAGCGLILLYAWIEFPFGNPAVTLAFWSCFFCAVRYHQLDCEAELSK